MKLSDHFTLEEATMTSHRGIDNTPNEAQLEAMKYSASQMEKVRAALDNRPVLVNSWLRVPALNAAVGGSGTSQHMKGEAIDFICPGFGTPYEVCMRISALKEVIRYDQLIYEGNWVHISFVRPPSKPRISDLTWMLDKSYSLGIRENRKEI